MLYLDAEKNDECALAAVLLARGVMPSTAQRCLVDGVTSSRLAYPDKKTLETVEEVKDCADHRAAIAALETETPAEDIPPGTPSSIQACFTARALRAESLKQVPVIYQTLPNGKTLAISADLSPAQIRTALDRALRT